MKYRRVIADVITVGLILLWSYTATIKLLNYQRFVQEVSWFPILSKAPMFFASGFLILIIGITIALAIAKSRLKGLKISLFLLIIMTIYLISIINLSDKIPCSCSSIWKNVEWKGNTYINIALLAANLIAIFLSNRAMHFSFLKTRYDTRTT